MAPQTIKDNAPNTLPADFSEWDGGAGAPPATLPDDFFDQIDTPPAAPTKVATPQTVTTPVVKKVLETPAASAKTKAAETAVSPFLPKSPKAPEPSKPSAAYSETRALPVPIKPKQSSVEPEEESEGKSKLPVKWIAIGAALLVLILAGIFIPRMFTKPTATAATGNQPAVAQPTATSPVAAPLSAQTKPTASTTKQQQQQQQQEAASQPVQQPKSVDSSGMIDQLVAPSRISQNIKSPEKESSPSQNFSASGMEGLGGTAGAPVGNALGGSAHPKVSFAAPKNVSISSGVASGLLLQRRDPVYPALAKQANVSGTVVLEATISKFGTIQGTHVLSGPVMLRQAAVDAVGSWRYKPYMLDGQPVDVQTTINLTFSLGR